MRVMVKVLTIAIPIQPLVDFLSHTTIQVGELPAYFCSKFGERDYCKEYPKLTQLLYFVPVGIELLMTTLIYAPIFFSLVYGHRVIFALGVIMLITNMVKQGQTLLDLLLNFELIVITEDSFMRDIYNKLFNPSEVDVSFRLRTPFYFVLGGFYIANIALPAAQLKW